MSGAYYNEFDLVAANWLRNLIAAGHIAPGVVDTRSIEDVRPDDLIGFTQCHFFAGIGVWSYALRAAGWPDDRPIWTGSCPCQPFSAAGEGAGFADERHLWPAFKHLIKERRPGAVVGEQVASKDADPWIDLVHADMEAMGYAFGAVAFPSAGIGAPHIRDRTYWAGVILDDASSKGLEGHARHGGAARRQGPREPVTEAGVSGGMANAEITGRSERRKDSGRGGKRSTPEGMEQRFRDGSIFGSGLANAANFGQHRGRASEAGDGRDAARLESERFCDASDRPGPTNGFWRDADWLGCRDGKWRPVSPLPQPLVDGSAESLGRVCAEAITEIEEEINAATAQSEGGRAAAMRNLLDHLGAEAQRCWPAGGIPRLHEAPFLLAFLRQLQDQGWRIAEGISLPCAEATSGELRSVWHQQEAARPPHQRGLEGQQPGECADPVRVLSCILARHAQATWDGAYAAHAESFFPLAHGARSRVGRLRGYGNAINAEAAIAFIECVIEDEAMFSLAQHGSNNAPFIENNTK